MRREFLATLERRVTLVTPSRRFAGLIADRYNADRLQAGSLTWEAPLVLPFSAWGNALIGPAFCFVVNNAAYHTFPFFHDDSHLIKFLKCY